MSGSQNGISLPHLFANKYQVVESERGGLAVNGINTQPVQPYNPQRNFMLPHISQKSRRPVPRHVYNVYSINKTQGSMLEAIEVYRRRPKKMQSPHLNTRKPYDVVFQPVPCPSPAEKSPTVSPQEEKTPPEHQQPVEANTATKVMRHPTKFLPVTISLQKRLEKLAKHKSKMTKKTSTKASVETVKEVSPRLAIGNSRNVQLPGMKGEHTTRLFKASFTSKMLPKIPKIPEERQKGLSYQLLEIPTRVSKPDTNQRTMFSHADYDMFQHNKFGGPLDKGVSIVEGPDAQMKAMWDYNKFLYLNVKI